MRRIICVILIGMLVSACSSDRSTSRPLSPAPSAQPAPAASASTEDSAAEAIKARSNSTLTDAQLQLWNDPAFQRTFTESYMAETEIEPRVTVVEREQMEKVLELISSDQMERAAELLRKEQGEASSAVFDFTLGNIYFQSDDLGPAVRQYTAAVEKFPKFRRAWRNLGLIYIRQGEFEQAVEPLTRVIELGGGDSVTYGLLGYAYSSIEKDLSAETAYRMATLIDPDTLDWKMGLARSLFKQERFADAVALCRGLLAEYPDRVDLWLLQANAYLGLNQPLRAAENYEIVDRMGGSTAASLSMLADIYVNEELYELAVERYVQAMEADPDSKPDRAIRAAKVLTARAATGAAARLINRIESLHHDRLSDAQRKDLLKLRARIAVANGSGEEEVNVLQEIVELDPLDGEALLLLGQHSRRSGDLEQAAFYFERAAAVEGFEADANVRHAQLLVSQGKYAEALPKLRRAQTLKPRENIQEYLEQVERIAKSR